MEAQANRRYFTFTNLTSFFMEVRQQHSCFKLPALLFLHALKDLTLFFLLVNYHKSVQNVS